MTELNTLIGLSKEFDISTLKVGQIYKITKERERSFPLHIAMLMVTHDWNFLGYAQAISIQNSVQQCQITFEVISLFSPNEQKLYRSKFLEAAKVTGEVK